MHLSNYSIHDDCYESIQQSTIIVACAITIIVYIVLSSLREIIQIYQQKLCYVLEIVNLISWILYISTLIMIMPVFKNDGSIGNVHYSAAAISVFLSWFRLLLLLQRFDQVFRNRYINIYVDTTEYNRGVQVDYIILHCYTVHFKWTVKITVIRISDIHDQDYDQDYSIADA